MTRSALGWTAFGVVTIAAAALVWWLPRPSPGTITDEGATWRQGPRERVIDLITRVADAEVEADQVYRAERKVWGDRHVNTDDARLHLSVLPRMTLRWRNIPVHPGARFNVAFGPNKVLLEKAHGRVRFHLELEDDAGTRATLHEEIVDPTDADTDRRVTVSLASFVDRTWTVVATTEPVDEAPTAWPAWTELRLESDGRPPNADDAWTTVELAGASLLDQFTAASVLEQHPTRPVARLSLSPQVSAERGALLGATPPSRVVFRLDQAKGAILSFGAGFDPRAPEPGAGATFVVRAGDVELHRETLAPTAAEAESGALTPWRIQLPPEAAHATTLTFETVAVDPTGTPPAAVWTAPRVSHRARLERSPDGRDRPNVLVLLVDTLRADRLGCYGCSRDTSPALDAFAQTSHRFAIARSQASWTLPSTASLFTGLYPLAHGVVSEHLTYLHGDFSTLAERLVTEGFTTGAFISNLLVSRESNFHQGFETYQTLSWANARKLNRRVLDWIDDCEGDRFFGYVHYVDPHDPYDAPEEFREWFSTPDNAFRGLKTKETLATALQMLAPDGGTDIDWDSPLLNQAARHLLDLYDSEIRYWDLCFGELMESLERRGLRRNTVVVVTSDHGEEFLEHRRTFHTQQLYEESIRIPLLIHVPGDDGSISLDPAELVDVLPTVLGSLGLRADDVQGRDLFDAGAAGLSFSATDLGADFAAEGRVVKHTVIDGSWKLIETPELQRQELYDLQHDPRERRDLASREPDRVSSLRRRLEAWIKDGLERRRAVGEGLDPAAAARMAELGYLDTSEIRVPQSPIDGASDQAPSHAPESQPPAVPPTTIPPDDDAS